MTWLFQKEKQRMTKGEIGMFLYQTFINVPPIALGTFRLINAEEDVEVTLAARWLKATILPSNRLRVGHDNFPTPNNDLVTAHWCMPEVLHQINRAWSPFGRKNLGRPKFFLDESMSNKPMDNTTSSSPRISEMPQVGTGRLLSKRHVELALP